MQDIQDIPRVQARIFWDLACNSNFLGTFTEKQINQTAYSSIQVPHLQHELLPDSSEENLTQLASKCHDKCPGPQEKIKKMFLLKLGW